VHVSRLADRFIRDPHEVVAVGDIVKVWVMEVDKERRRVSLTMVCPGSERPRRPARGEGGDARQGQQAGHDQAGHDQARGQQGDRPPRPSQGRQGGRPGGPQNQQGGRPQGGRPQGGRPQGGRPQGRPQSASASQQGGAPQGEGSPGGKPREDRRGGYGGPPPRRPRPQGPDQGRPHEFKPKPKPLIPITDAMKKGKEPMRTFGDLMQFFGAKPDEKKPPAPSKREQGENRGPAAADLPPADTAAEPAVPMMDGDPVDANREAPPPATPLSPQPAESVAPPLGEPSPEPQTPPLDEGQKD
jgi:uncharacterized protein